MDLCNNDLEIAQMTLDQVMTRPQVIRIFLYEVRTFLHRKIWKYEPETSFTLVLLVTLNLPK